MNDLIIVGSGALSYGLTSGLRENFAKMLDFRPRILDHLKVHQWRHRLGYHLDIVNWIKPGTAPRWVKCFDLPASLPKTDEVYIHPFSSEAARLYPVEYWRELINSIGKNYKMRLSCVEKDLDKNPQWRDVAKEFGLELDTRPLKDKFEAFKHAALVISVDTSVAHLAAFAGAPLVCLAPDKWRNLTIPYPPEINAPNLRFHYVECDYRQGVCGPMEPCVRQESLSLYA